MQEIVFGLNEASGQPVFLRLSQAIIEAIEQGRLKPGQRLPGTRTLAATLKLHRNTVDAAYHEAAMQGWLVTEAARGTFVARDLPDLGTQNWGVRPAAARLASPLPQTRPAPPPMQFSDGAPDARLMPGLELARAFRRSLTG
ncbi:hypothetical protein LTR94_023112, partial [Friedmanniomyces endolithicus]